VEHIRARRAEAEAELERFGDALAKRIGSDLVVRTHVVEGAPMIEICRIAESVRADLVIAGSHGRTGFRRAMIGSVAERIVRHAGRPVLIVPGAHSHRRRR
jgi:nucleotide-binding universal stress UspA family protein